MTGVSVVLMMWCITCMMCVCV